MQTKVEERRCVGPAPAEAVAHTTGTGPGMCPQDREAVSVRVAAVDDNRQTEGVRKVQVPVLGMIENMSAFVCPHCGETTKVFGPGGAESEAARLGVPLLGSIPIDPRIATGGDAGTPIVSEIPDSPAAVAFLKVAGRLREALG